MTPRAATDRRVIAPELAIGQHHGGHSPGTQPEPEEVDPSSRCIRLGVEGQVHDRLPVRLRDLPCSRPVADRIVHHTGGRVIPKTEGHRLAVPPCRADTRFLRAGRPHPAKPAVRDQGARIESPDVAPGGEDQVLLRDPDPKARIVIDVEVLIGRCLRGEDDRADRTAEPDPAARADLLDQVGTAWRELVEDEESRAVGLGRRNQDAVLGEEPYLPPGERAVELRIVLAVSVRIEVRKAGDRRAACL